MADFNPASSSASTWQARREPRSLGLGRSHLFAFIEAALDPVVLVISLWSLALFFEGEVRPAYLILSVIVFSLTFPGTANLRLPVWKVFFNIAFNWVWIAGLLLFLGFVTEYIYKLSIPVLGNWLWLAPVAQAGAHVIIRVAAPRLVKLQGPARTAVIVGMNDQGF